MARGACNRLPSKVCHDEIDSGEVEAIFARDANALEGPKYQLSNPVVSLKFLEGSIYLLELVSLASAPL